MKKIIFSLLAALVLLLQSPEVLAWGQEGHRIVGRIAYDHLTRKARRQVDAVLGQRGLIYWANWPDEIKSDTIYPDSHDWHFQDLAGGMSDSAVVAALSDYPKEGGNLFRATDSLYRVLQHDKTNYDALRFLVHLEGDRFCPMHMGHMDDKGGNSVRFKWFGRNTNLHSIWDSGIIESRGYTYSEYADYLEDALSGEKKAILNMSREDIVLHNYHLTSAIYDYQETWNGNAYHYVYHFKDDMEWQLYAAGIRLAKLLNELYR